MDTTPLLKVRRICYNKKYYEKNKESLLKIQRVKVKCPICDTMVNKSGINKHNKTKKHMKNLEKHEVEISHTVEFD